MGTSCKHSDQIREVKPSGWGCQECVTQGEDWVSLRICLSCGHVGCCDSSRGHHSTRHFKETGHPIIASFEPGETWGWCFIDEVELEHPRKGVEKAA